MRRPQFSLKTLLWLTALVAAFFGGREIGIRDERQRLGDTVTAEIEHLQNHWSEQMAVAKESVRQYGKMVEDRRKFDEEVTRDR